MSVLFQLRGCGLPQDVTEVEIVLYMNIVKKTRVYPLNNVKIMRIVEEIISA